MSAKGTGDELARKAADDLRARYDLDDEDMRALALGLADAAGARSAENVELAERFTDEHRERSTARQVGHRVPERWEPSLGDYIDIAAYLIGADRVAIAALPRLALAESALHVPFASFGGIEAYPTLVDEAAVLLQHLAKNHPLSDANKRAAFLLTARSSTPNGLHGDRRTLRPTLASSSASPPVIPATRRSSHGSASRRRVEGMSRPPSPEPRAKHRKLRGSTRGACAQEPCDFQGFRPVEGPERND